MGVLIIFWGGGGCDDDEVDVDDVDKVDKVVVSDTDDARGIYIHTYIHIYIYMIYETDTDDVEDVCDVDVI